MTYVCQCTRWVKLLVFSGTQSTVGEMGIVRYISILNVFCALFYGSFIFHRNYALGIGRELVLFSNTTPCIFWHFQKN